jgi:hypothetical protein
MQMNAETMRKAENSDSRMSRNNLTPRRAIRKICIDCAGGTSEVKDCQGDKLHEGTCLFYPYRMGKGRPSVKLIRKYCLWCMGGSPKLVRDCACHTCPLFLYRMGRNPKVKGRKLSDKRLKALAAGPNIVLNPEKGHVVQGILPRID